MWLLEAAGTYVAIQFGFLLLYFPWAYVFVISETLSAADTISTAPCWKS